MTQKPHSNKDIETLYHLKSLEVNSILEMTQAINYNYPENNLYTIYRFILRGTLHIDKLLLFVKDKTWSSKVSFGTDYNFTGFKLKQGNLDSYKTIQEISSLDLEQKELHEFDLIIPILHKDKPLAYVFLNRYYKDSNKTLKEVDTNFVHALSNIMLVAIENKKLFRKQIAQETYKKELEIARKVQNLLFPEKLPYTDTLKVKSIYYPHAQNIGGDFYDYIPISEDKFLICIADVSGKGVPAALLMSNFQAALRTLARQTDNLSQIIEELNYSIYQNARGEHFITLFAAIYDKKKRQLSYINAGHNPAFFFDYQKKQSALLDKGTTVLGAFSPLPFLNKTVFENLENFLIFSYTDGLTEATNEEGEQFGLDRLLEFLKSRKTIEISALHGRIFSKLQNFKGKNIFNDDVTLLSCRVNMSV